MKDSNAVYIYIKSQLPLLGSRQLISRQLAQMVGAFTQPGP